MYGLGLQGGCLPGEIEWVTMNQNLDGKEEPCNNNWESCRRARTSLSESIVRSSSDGNQTPLPSLCTSESPSSKIERHTFRNSHTGCWRVGFPHPDPETDRHRKSYQSEAAVFTQHVPSSLTPSHLSSNLTCHVCHSNFLDLLSIYNLHILVL